MLNKEVTNTSKKIKTSVDIFAEEEKISIVPNKTYAALMVCPGTRIGQFTACLSVLRNAQFFNYQVIYAGGDLLKENLLAKRGDGQEIEAISNSGDETEKWISEAFFNIKKILNSRHERYCKEVQELPLETLIEQLKIKYIDEPEQLSALERDILFWNDVPSVLKSWEIISKHANYVKYQEMIEERYRIDSEFRGNMVKSINGFMEKYSNESEDKEIINEKWNRCFKYKVKEIAGLYVKRDLGIDLIIYDGNLCPVLSYVVKEMEREGTLRFRHIDTKNKKLNEVVIFSEQNEKMREIHRFTRETVSNFGLIKGSATYFPGELSPRKIHTPTYFKSCPEEATVFEEVRLMIRNSGSPSEAMKIITTFQLLLTSEMAALTLSSYKEEKPSGAKKLTDNGIYYANK